jgi:hypothetical protein
MTQPVYRYPTVEHPSEIDLWLENDEPIMLRAVAGTDPVELTADEARALGRALIELADVVDDLDC